MKKALYIIGILIFDILIFSNEIQASTYNVGAKEGDQWIWEVIEVHPDNLDNTVRSYIRSKFSDVVFDSVMFEFGARMKFEILRIASYENYWIVVFNIWKWRTGEFNENADFMAYSTILKTPYYNTKYVLLPIPVDQYIDESNASSYYDKPVPNYREGGNYNSSVRYEALWSYDEDSGVLKSFRYSLQRDREEILALSFMYEFIRPIIISFIIIVLILIVSLVSIIEILPRVKKTLQTEKVKSIEVKG